VLAESQMMVPDSNNRLEAAQEKLGEILEEAEEEGEVDESLKTEAATLMGN
jgi:hypothetical protein